MNIAQRVKNTIEKECPGTFSLYAGYGMAKGEYVRFPNGLAQREKRNESGRCTLAEYVYADGSILVYRYSTTTETYTLTVKNPKPE